MVRAASFGELLPVKTKGILGRSNIWLTSVLDFMLPAIRTCGGAPDTDTLGIA